MSVQCKKNIIEKFLPKSLMKYNYIGNSLLFLQLSLTVLIILGTEIKNDHRFLTYMAISWCFLMLLRHFLL